MGGAGQSDKDKSKKGEVDSSTVMFKPAITPFVPGG